MYRLPLVSLVDVVFILLFFFMLASSPAREPRSVPVALGAAVSAPAADAALRIRVLSATEVDAGGERLTPAALAPYLQAQPLREARLSAGPQAQLQDLLAAMDLLRAAGLRCTLEAAP